MSEEKFTPSYFEQNYHIAEYKNYKNVVHRNEDSSGCSSKDECLKACFAHFIKENLTNVKKISDHFTKSKQLFRDGVITRCCCSQHQEDGITHGIVTHNQSNMSFILGSVCFLKQFEGAEDAKTFWKDEEECKFCAKIVKKKNTNRPYFCNQLCVRNYEIQERCKRNAEYEKKEREKREKNMYGSYVPPPKKVWSQKVYLKCVECNAPKKNENQQKWALCYNCKIKEDEEDLFNGF